MPEPCPICITLSPGMVCPGRREEATDHQHMPEEDAAQTPGGGRPLDPRYHYDRVRAHDSGADPGQGSACGAAQ